VSSEEERLHKIISGIKAHLDILKEEGVVEVDMPVIEKTFDDLEETLSKTQKIKKRSAAEKRDALIQLKEKVLPCIKCGELASGRTNVVFGAGNANAKLCFIGEAPGRDEDLQGLPFVGRAGGLLTKIIESIGLTRKQVFIGNVLKCRPPQNRNPAPDEIRNCEPYLIQQLEIIQPKVICALGKFAAQTLLKTDEPISTLRGKFHDYHGIKLIPTFHPAYLLRNPSAKKTVWEDMKKIKKELEKS